jgi:hypothetical protein
VIAKAFTHVLRSDCSRVVLLDRTARRKRSWVLVVCLDTRFLPNFLPNEGDSV